MVNKESEAQHQPQRQFVNTDLPSMDISERITTINTDEISKETGI